jgi:hypothetical protein
VTTSLVSGTGGPLILEVFQFAGGPLIDLSGTPTITITSLSDGGVVVGPTTVGVTHPSVGTYLYNWSAPVSGGLYQAVWDGMLGGDPYQGSEIFTVYSPSATTVGPCDGWNIDTGCCSDWAGYSSELKSAATSYASTVLWAATGRRFGLCTRTIRPCGRNCSDGNGGFGGGWYWSQGTWMPYLFNGVWRNCWCGCGGASCCGCNVNCQVYLPGPVAAVLSVEVDGEVIDPTTYRVDNGIWLVRTRTQAEDSEQDPPCWPVFQNYNFDSGEHTFFVTYQQGLPVPQPLLRAAGELACEYAKACLGLPCRLPARATSIARQGVSINLVDVNTLLERGLTGVATVDQLIAAYNPYGLKSAMRVVSPDTEIIRETTWP